MKQVICFLIYIEYEASDLFLKVDYEAMFFLTLIHAAKGPKGLSCFEKQTAKHILLWVFGKFGKLCKDYFHIYGNFLKIYFPT